MNDDSDDGEYFQGESFFTEKINTINSNCYSEQKYNDNEEESYPYEKNYIDNCNYNGQEEMNSLGDDNIKTENNTYSSDYNNYCNYADYNENGNYYINNNYYNNNYSNYNNENNFNNNSFYSYHRKRKRIYNNKYKENNKEKFKIIKNKEYYISSFQIIFRKWFLKTVIESKGEIKFTQNKKINKDILDSLNKKSNHDNEQINVNITDVKIHRIVSHDINIEFNIIIKEELELFFVQKYIEIKVKGEIEYNKYAKFYFNVMQYKLSLTVDNNNINKKANNDNIILNAVKRKINDKKKTYVLQLDLSKRKMSDGSDENKNEIIDLDEDLSRCVNELIENVDKITR